jgi:hypothetical protein
MMRKGNLRLYKTVQDQIELENKYDHDSPEVENYDRKKIFVLLSKSKLTPIQYVNQLVSI